MPNLPRYYRRVRPTPSAGNAIIPSDLGQSVFRAQAGVGKAITQFGGMVFEKQQRAEAIDQINTFQADTLDAVFQKQQSLDPNTDPETYRKDVSDLLKRRRDDLLNVKNPIARERLGQWMKNYEVRENHNALLESQKIFARQARARLELNISRLEAQAIAGDVNAQKQLEKTILQAGGLGIEEDGVSLLNKDESEIMLAESMERIDKGLQKQAKERAEAAINSIKPMIVDALGEDMADKKAAMSVIESNLAEMRKSGLIDDVQEAEGLRSLNNYMKDVAQEYKETKKSNVINTYESFADKLLAGTFTGDDLALDKTMTKSEKDEIWIPVLEGKRKPAPTKTTLDGTNILVNTITDYSNGVIGKKEAINNIVQARYVGMTMTDGQYEFALGKIKDKYPPYIADTIQKVTKSADAVLDEKGWFFGFDWKDKDEKEKLVQVSNNTLMWVEEQKRITDKYPEPDAIYNQMRKFGVMVETPKVLPKKPVIIKPAPKPTDPLYVSTDEDFASIPVGSEFYSDLLGQWVIKEKE